MEDEVRAIVLPKISEGQLQFAQSLISADVIDRRSLLVLEQTNERLRNDPFRRLSEAIA